jgi:hypothetical protein
LLLSFIVYFFPNGKKHKIEKYVSQSELFSLNKNQNNNVSEKINDFENIKNNIDNESRLMNLIEMSGSLLSIKNTGYFKSIENIKNESNSNKKLENKKFNNLFDKTISLFKNPVYICVVIAGTVEGMLQNGFLAFASLFLEYQYRLASGTSSLIIGIISIPAVIVGGLLGGVICEKLNNKTISCFKLIIFLLIFNVITYAGFLIYCKEPILISNDNNFNAHLKNNNSQDSCYTTSTNCDCDLKIFKPVCLNGSNDIYFQSPCLAGCNNFVNDNNNNYYSNCSQSYCNDYFNDNADIKNAYFVDGLCQTDSCYTKLIISYSCIFMLMLLNSLLFLPYLKVTIGSVDSPEMNSILLGLKQFFMNAFGTIPGPILFGTVIDSTCSYWHTDSYGQYVCKMYNNQNFAIGFGLLGITSKAFCLFFVILSYFFYNLRNKN